ncbi:hypothetical protein [Moritella sp. F3]|uniref:hypothetical protein n=1 Tax=Moritella sp. F3 TaxID=2718882 RepID=UPI0018E16D91|nr:hypothetical protein [Moritella sp. F3]GIC77601.1 hypothetical protein FMO001_23280 [Moritella sp. F1]GIC82014.1 hypothetical protein FMO003_22950 [Moritella sp. F3]
MGYQALLQLVVAFLVLKFVFPKIARYYYIMKWHMKDDLDTASKGAVAKEHLADLRAESEESEAPSVLPCDSQSLIPSVASGVQTKTTVANQIEPEITVVSSPEVETNDFETQDLSTPAFLRCGNGEGIMARIAAQAKKVEPPVVEVFSHAKTAAKQVASATQLTQSETNYTYKGFGTLEPSRF